MTLHERSGGVRLGRRMADGIQEFGCWNSGIQVNIQEFKQNSRWRASAEGPSDFADSRLRPELRGVPDNDEMMTAGGYVTDRRQQWAEIPAEGKASERA